MRVLKSSVGLGPLLVAVLIVSAVGVGTAIASIPNPGDGSYYACLVRSSGAMRVVNFPKVDTCPKGQKLISWNAAGPQGVAGPAGAQGAQGPQGPAGPAGITKITITSVEEQTTASGAVGTTGFVNAACPAGSKVTGGGFSQPGDTLRITDSRQNGPIGWTVYYKKMEAGDAVVRAHVYCISTEPSTVIARAGTFRVAAKRGK